MTAVHLGESIRTSTRPGASLNTIVVATDFSEHAAKALNWAHELAMSHGAKVVLVHAIETELPAFVEQGLLDHHVRHKLERLRDLHRVNGRTAFAPGKPWDVISKVSREEKADLIVLGAHGQSQFSERFLGTVADRLIKTTSIPVMVHREPTTRTASHVRTVLAATDFSEQAAVAISAAVRLLGGTSEPARIVLFHTVALMIDYPDFNVAAPIPQYWDDAERSAARQLEILAAALRTDQLQVEVKTFRGFPAHGIVAEAERVNADLIAIGTVGRTGLNRFFMGSVAEQVLHHAKCSVLTARTPDPSQPIAVSANEPDALNGEVSL